MSGHITITRHVVVRVSVFGHIGSFGRILPKQDMRTEVGTDIQFIFISKDRAEAEMRLRDMVKEYHKIAPRLADWKEKAIPEGLTFFPFAPSSYSHKQHHGAPESGNKAQDAGS